MLENKEIKDYINTEFEKYYNNYIQILNNISLEEILKDLNFYLPSFHRSYTVGDFVSKRIDAFLQSQEETMFGDFLEGVEIFICGKIFGGVKSKLIGIDLEFERDNIKYVVEIKSGPNWGNSSQIQKMKADFTTAKKALRTSNSNLNVIAVNGCCYGRDNKQDKGEYFKYCVQRFWEFISNNENLYIDIIEPLGQKSTEKNFDFTNAYNSLINKFTKEFANEFCDNGIINWKN